MGAIFLYKLYPLFTYFFQCSPSFKDEHGKIALRYIDSPFP